MVRTQCKKCGSTDLWYGTKKWSYVQKSDGTVRNYQHPIWQCRTCKSKKQAALRDEILALLGRRCAMCEVSDVRVLQIDHVHGGGYQERKKLRNFYKYYLEVLASVKLDEKKYQLLCANCNVIKGSEVQLHA